MTALNIFLLLSSALFSFVNFCFNIRMYFIIQRVQQLSFDEPYVENDESQRPEISLGQRLHEIQTTKFSANDRRFTK